MNTPIECKTTRTFIWGRSQLWNGGVDNSFPKNRKYWCIDFTDCTTISSIPHQRTRSGSLTTKDCVWPAPRIQNPPQKLLQLHLYSVHSFIGEGLRFRYSFFISDVCMDFFIHFIHGVAVDTKYLLDTLSFIFCVWIREKKNFWYIPNFFRTSYVTILLIHRNDKVKQ